MSNKIGEAFGNAWNTITNQAQQTANDIGQGVSNAVSNAEQAVADGINEFADGVAKEMNDVGEKAKDGDFLGAVLEMSEVGGLGVLGSEGLAALGLTPDDQLFKEMTSGLINFMSGNTIGALKDMGDAFGAMSASGANGGGGTQAPAPSHSNERPSRAASRRRSRGNRRAERGSSSREAAKARAKEEAKAKAKEKAERAVEMSAMATRISLIEEALASAGIGKFRDKVGDGYGESGVRGGSVADQLQQVMKQIESIISQLKAKPGAVTDRFSGGADWLNGMRGNDGSEVSKLPPNATFEDLVAAFMMDVIKDKQQQVKDMMNEMKELNAQKKLAKAGDKVNKALKQAGSAVLSLCGPLGSATSAISELTGPDSEAIVDDIENSRQMLFEKLKNEMNKLQEMMQALSNVLNSMHQGAMNAVRNIK